MSFVEEFKWYVRLGYWHTRAALGSVKAKYDLGRYYETTKTDRKDMNKAVLFYVRAASKGYVPAQTQLGDLYAQGRGGIEKNEKKSLYWYAKAAEQYRLKAEQGNAEDQWKYGLCYAYGKGVEKNPEQAVLWYTKAAEQGEVRAQVNLAHCYSQGNGVAQNFETAVCWTRKAAEQGHARAQNNLGDYYENGKGVEQSYEQAFYWYHKAAKQGDKYAQHSVGVFYRDGLGVKQDHEKAIYWLKMAIGNGRTEAVEDLKKCQGLFSELDWYWGYDR